MSRLTTVAAAAHENTYADPHSSPAAQSSCNAPTTTVPALTETESPKKSPVAASEAPSFCYSTQEVPSKWNTYADPQSSPTAQSARYAPTTIVLPLTETQKPKKIILPRTGGGQLLFCDPRGAFQSIDKY